MTIALITGGTRGLGRALVLGFAREGYRVYATARGEGDLAALGDEARADGLDVIPVRADAASADDADRLAERLAADRAVVDVVIHNAGLLGERSELADYPVKTWDRVMAANVRGPFVLTQRLLPHLAPNAALLFVSSGVSLGPRRLWGAYNVSKIALDGLAGIYANELAPRGIRVYIVDPGKMRTEMRAAAYPTEDPQTLDTPEKRVPGFLYLVQHATMAMSGGRYIAEELAQRATRS